MKTYRSKRLYFILIAVFLASVLLFTGAFLLFERAYFTENTARLAMIADAILERYPDVPEEEILRLFREEQTEKADKTLFARYGTEEAEPVGNAEKTLLTRLLLAGAGSIALAAGAALFSVYMDKRRLKKQTASLEKYLSEIEQGVYSLRIEENSEEELSHLTNQIYDLTVRFRENAQNSRKQSESLTRWLQDISHQIRTPLTSAVIMLDNLADTPDIDDVTQREFVTETRRQLLLIADLIEALLKLSKFDSGTVKMHPVPLTAETLIHEAKSNLAVLLDVKDIGIETAGDLNVPFEADRRWQTEALTNVIKNCAEHSPQNAVIRITAEDTGIFLRLTVRDEGEGIDERDLPHIFERFYKAKNAGPDSIGIGLSLAKTVIEKENGFISVKSREGAGTTFTIGYRR